jgi:hypothetical protein
MKFYVYELRDDRGVTFYVGKGSGRRIHEHRYKATSGELSAKARFIRALLRDNREYTAEIVYRTNIERHAFAVERWLIALHGRDRLTNHTDGGDGVPNLSPEGRERIAASRRGKIASAETREKQRKAKLGKPRSAETRKKISNYQRGSKHPWARLPRSEETRRKMGWFAGQKHSPETIAKMRAAKLGHSVSEETRRKISETKRARAQKDVAPDS